MALICVLLLTTHAALAGQSTASQHKVLQQESAGAESGAEASAPSPLPQTDWFSAAGHGIFTHFLNGLQNNYGRNSLGKNSTWDECVTQFDVDAYASDAAATGAKYAFITVMQGDQYMIAPNARFDNLTGYSPGEACSTRDLVLDLWGALNKRGLKLGLYWTGDGPARDPKGAAGMNIDGSPSGENMKFVERWTSVLREYAVRYGDKVFGWWVDGCYSGIGYNDTALKYYHDAIRAGNPQAIIGLNNGVHPVIDSGSPWEAGGETTKWEDITAGETNSFNGWAPSSLPRSRWVTGPTARSPPKPFQKSEELATVQWHQLSFLGSQWASPGTCNCPGISPNCSATGCSEFSPTDLKVYTQKINAVGGVLTVDLQLLRNGSLNRAQITTLRSSWDEHRLCAADYGNSTCCCGQAASCGGPGIGAGIGVQCKLDKPTCVGFHYGSTYGHCV